MDLESQDAEPIEMRRPNMSAPSERTDPDLQLQAAWLAQVSDPTEASVSEQAPRQSGHSPRASRTRWNPSIARPSSMSLSPWVRSSGGRGVVLRYFRQRCHGSTALTSSARASGAVVAFAVVGVIAHDQLGPFAMRRLGALRVGLIWRVLHRSGLSRTAKAMPLWVQPI
jgi:hypothetical protein